MLYGVDNLTLISYYICQSPILHLGMPIGELRNRLEWFLSAPVPIRVSPIGLVWIDHCQHATDWYLFYQIQILTKLVKINLFVIYFHNFL